jgi:hypothetical protein
MTDDFVPAEDRYQGFPEGFFTRFDEDDDPRFYGEARLVQHIDSGAIAAVRDLYDELGLYGEVLDLCRLGPAQRRPAPDAAAGRPTLRRVGAPIPAAVRGALVGP